MKISFEYGCLFVVVSLFFSLDPTLYLNLGFPSEEHDINPRAPYRFGRIITMQGIDGCAAYQHLNSWLG